jgi:signal recognition particle subunit SRP72
VSIINCLPQLSYPADDLALDICQTSEDLTPEDRAAELLPIAVQYLYVLLRLGKTEQAEALLQEISVEE